MMTTTDIASPPTGSPSHRRWVTWAAVLLLVALILLVALLPGLRALATDTWREMRSIPPGYLALIFACKVMQSLFSALTWRNALLAAWPTANLSYRFVLGVEQGQVALNTIAPARAGTWAMLGIYGLSIRGARAPKLLAVWGVQNLAFVLFAAVNYTVVAIGLPNQTRPSSGVTDRVSNLASAQPLAAGAMAVIIVILLIAATTVARRKVGQVRQVRQQVREGLAILHPPAQYLRLLFLPALVSYGFNCAAYVVLLAAFGIPVTIWTLTLALGSNALAGAVRITPGGLGTTQAIDVIALRAYAAPDVVTAYSLSEIAITAVISSTIAIAALVSVSGWHETRALLLHRRDFSTGLHRLGERQRALKSRALRRKRPTGGE